MCLPSKPDICTPSFFHRNDLYGLAWYRWPCHKRCFQHAQTAINNKDTFSQSVNGRQRQHPFRSMILSFFLPGVAKILNLLYSIPGIRPYQCAQCDKSFTQSGHLVNHLRLHDGEKPYRCSVCNRRFTQSGHLASHAKMHNSSRGHECGICHKGFIRVS